MLKGTAREAAAEFLGTFILIVFGVGVVAQTVLSRNANGSYLGINIGWGLAVMLGVYMAGGISGAHLNPAVTLALAVTRGFSWTKVAPYVIAQIAGAFVASAVVFFTYREAFDAFDSGVRQVAGPAGTAGIFATYPQPFLSIFGGFVDQVVGTALLMAGVLAVTDQRNNAAPGWLTPVLVGGIVIAIGVSRSGTTLVTRSILRATSGRGSLPRLLAGAATSSPSAVVGGGCRSSRRRSAPSSARSCTTRWQPVITRRSPSRRNENTLCPRPRSGHHVEPRDRVRSRRRDRVGCAGGVSAAVPQRGARRARPGSDLVVTAQDRARGHGRGRRHRRGRGCDWRHQSA